MEVSIFVLWKNYVRPDKLYAFIIISFSVFALDVPRYSLSAMQTFIFHCIYVRYSLSAKIMKAYISYNFVSAIRIG